MYTYKAKRRRKGRITKGQVCEYKQFLASQCYSEGMREGRAECTGQDNTQTEVVFSPSRALVFKVGLFDASAEGQQVAKALDPLCQLRAGQSGGQYGEEVTKHQRIQFCRPTTHTGTHTQFITAEINYSTEDFYLNFTYHLFYDQSGN